MAFLLRLAFLETMERYQWLQAHPPVAVVVLAERVSFTGEGTDSCAYGFFVWKQGNTQWPEGLNVISWKAP